MRYVPMYQIIGNLLSKLDKMVNDDADNDAHNASDGDFDREGKTQHHDAQIQFEWGCHSKMLSVIQPGEG